MIKLREIEYDDIRIINRWRNDPEVIKTLGANYRYINLETEKRWYENYLEHRDRNIRLMIVAENEPVGMVNLLNIDHLNRHAEFSIQIGNTKFQSKGIGTRATQMILSHGFENLNLHRIYLTVLKTNERAIALYKKIGFVKEGTLREVVYKNDEYADMLLMSMLKNEYETIKNSWKR